MEVGREEIDFRFGVWVSEGRGFGVSGFKVAGLSSIVVVGHCRSSHVIAGHGFMYASPRSGDGGLRVEIKGRRKSGWRPEWAAELLVGGGVTAEIYWPPTVKKKRLSSG